LIKLTKARIKAYDDILPTLSENRQESAKNICGDDIEELRERLANLEKIKS
jgi:hypothetical protein